MGFGIAGWPARWLYWVALFYPLHLAAQFYLYALPAVALGHWGELRIDPFILRGPGPAQASGLWLAAAALPLVFCLRRIAAQSAPLWLAAVGAALGLRPLAGMFFFRAFDPPSLVAAGLGALLVYLGWRWAAAAAPGRFLARALLVATACAAPAILVPLLLFPGRMRGPAALWTGAPLLLLALLAPLPAGDREAGSNWRGLLAAAVLTAVLALGTTPAREWLDRRQRDEVAATIAALPKPDPAAPFPRQYFHRGVNFTANGFSYESRQARELLLQLPQYGIREIALVPYGRFDRRTTRSTPAGPRTWESDEGIEILTAIAHQQGMRVMLKPHIWKPAEADLPDGESRRHWFAGFGEFIERYARLAQRVHADTFCLGTEFGWLTRHEAEWRAMIARVRSVYAGPLVYASNHGPEFETIRFWDALDYIGIDNYYPLGDGYSTAGMAARIEKVVREFNRPLLFTETGYSSSPGAHQTPWDDKRTGPVDLDEQMRCYEALYAAFYHQPWFRGMYWWKIETDGIGGASHPGMVPWRKPTMEVIRKWYGQRSHAEQEHGGAIAP